MADFAESFRNRVEDNYFELERLAVKRGHAPTQDGSKLYGKLIFISPTPF